MYLREGPATMTAPFRPAERRSPQFRLTAGLELLDQWSEHATQAEINAVNRVLFALVDRTAFYQFPIIDDAEKAAQFFVLAECNLAVKVCLHDLNCFEIAYVGPAGDAPGLDLAKPAQEPLGAEPAPDSYAN
jgi:hypothetical protein